MGEDTLAYYISPVAPSHIGDLLAPINQPSSETLEKGELELANIVPRSFMSD